jgi:hypothetical protein
MKETSYYLVRVQRIYPVELGFVLSMLLLPAKAGGFNSQNKKNLPGINYRQG